MTTRCQALLAVAAIAAAGPAFAGSDANGDAVAHGHHDDIRSEIRALLQSDSTRIATRQQAKESFLVSEVPVPGTVVMSAYVLREPKDRDVAMPRYETPTMKFLRDGTIYTHIGRKYSTQVLLRFYQSQAPPIGNLPPARGIQLSLTLAW